MEEDERLTLMPFEKNLDVWRQLWRVLERSHIVVQVSLAQLKAVRSLQLQADPVCSHSACKMPLLHELSGPTGGAFNAPDVLLRVYELLFGGHHPW